MFSSYWKFWVVMTAVGRGLSVGDCLALSWVWRRRQV